MQNFSYFDVSLADLNTAMFLRIFQKVRFKTCRGHYNLVEVGGGQVRIEMTQAAPVSRQGSTRTNLAAGDHHSCVPRLRTGTF